MQDIGSKTACAYHDGRALKLTNGTRQLEQFQRLVERNGFHTLIGRHLSKQWFLDILGSTDLYDRTKTANLDVNGFACLRILA